MNILKKIGQHQGLSKHPTAEVGQDNGKIGKTASDFLQVKGVAQAHVERTGRRNSFSRIPTLRTPQWTKTAHFGNPATVSIT